MGQSLHAVFNTNKNDVNFGKCNQKLVLFLFGKSDVIETSHASENFLILSQCFTDINFRLSSLTFVAVFI